MFAVVVADGGEWVVEMEEAEREGVEGEGEGCVNE